jgi:hypothetical protein
MQGLVDVAYQVKQPTQSAGALLLPLSLPAGRPWSRSASVPCARWDDREWYLSYRRPTVPLQ